MIYQLQIKIFSSSQPNLAMSNMRLRSRGLSPSSQRRTSSASSSTVTGGGAGGSSSRSQRRTARLESCPTSSQVQSRRNREETRGCPPAPHNSVDQSVIVLDDTLQVSQAKPSYSACIYHLQPQQRLLNILILSSF